MTQETTADQPTHLHWDSGTGYELFICLLVLHTPEKQGLRASWAAGIRSRIPAVERKLLEEVVPFLTVPTNWIYHLQGPKDALSVLWALRQIPAVERIRTVFEIEQWSKSEVSRLSRIAEKHTWDEEDYQVLIPGLCKDDKPGQNPDALKKFLDWWAQPEKFGELYLAALQAFYQVFFVEDEKRIAPVLQSGLEHAQALSKTMTVQELLVVLSQGVRMTDFSDRDEVILVPAYWITPLLLHAEIEKDGRKTYIFMFGVRPDSMSIIPGEVVPDGLLRALKALADSTRLKIMNYLSGEELSPSELARRLHLRAPTVTHHLNELRLAGLVNLTIHGQEKHYTARREALPAMLKNLESFLDNTGEPASHELDDPEIVEK